MRETHLCSKTLCRGHNWQGCMQEMVNYHMVSAAGRGPSSFLAPAFLGQAAPPAPRRPRPAWTALRAGSEDAELAGGGRLSALLVCGWRDVMRGSAVSQMRARQ